MIQSFKNKRLKALFEDGNARGVPADMVERILRRLDVIDAATVIQDINLPGYRLHQLRGDRKGTWSVTVSGNWRLTFTFRNGNALDVDLEDYH